MARAVLPGIAGIAGLLLAGCAVVNAGQGGPPAASITIAGTDVFPESMTADATGNLYVGSGTGTIYRAAPGAREALPWVTADPHNGLRSLFGVLADDARGLLWVCSNPDLFARDPSTPITALKAVSLASGKLEASFDFPTGKPAACNDIAVARDGTVFATETASGRLFALPRGAAALSLFAEGAELIGVDGIAFSEDGTMYINNVRQNRVQRVDRAPDGSYAGLTDLALSQPVGGPDALRPLGGNTFLQAEGATGRIALVTVNGDRAQVVTLAEGLGSTAAATHFGRTAYTVEGKIAYRIDPKLQGQDPGAFVIHAYALPALPGS